MVAEAKALFFLDPQGTSAVRPKEIPKPEQGELLVELHATSLNPVDWKIQYDEFSFPGFEYPGILGTDSAGVVKEVGEGVTGFVVGDKVYVPTAQDSIFSFLSGLTRCAIL